MAWDRGQEEEERTVISPSGAGRLSGRGAQHPQPDCGDGPARPPLQSWPGSQGRRVEGGAQRISAGRGGAGLQDPSCGDGAVGGSRAAGAEAEALLHHRPPPLARVLLPHIPLRSGNRLSPAPPLRLLPGALGPFRRALGRRAGGSPAPSAPRRSPPPPAPRPPARSRNARGRL